MTRRKAKKIPEHSVDAEIEGFCHDGRGLTHIDGRVTFVDGGLPGEHVELKYTALKRDFAEAKVERVLDPSPLRTVPKCASFGRCGGCSFQHIDPNRQIEVKQQILEEQFRRIGRLDRVPLWPPIRGPFWAYRHKARLGVKYVAKKQKVLVGFREKASTLIADIERCEVLHPRVADHLTAIGDLINVLSIRDRIPQIEVAVGDSACVLVFRNLAETSAEDRRLLQDFGQRHDFTIYLQPNGPDSLSALDDSAVGTLSYSLPGQHVTFDFAPLQFTQVNVELNRRMVDRAIELLDPGPNDRVIDLFCGIGNFTLPIARHVERAVGIEGSKVLIEQASKNAELNRIANVEFWTADLSTEVRQEPWCRESYTMAILDPPRTGAEEILKYFPRWGVKSLLYVSCNPSTLARDAGILTREFGYRIQGAGVMDMFPQTAHVESIALFEKN